MATPRMSSGCHVKMKGLQQAFVPATRPLARSSAMRTMQRSSHLQIHCRESRAGRVPIVVPKTVKVTIDGQTMKVKGKVEFERTFPDVVTFSMFENPKKAGETVIKFKPINDSREALSMHGLSRALAANMVQGASDGFTKRMEMVGTGFRASFANNQLTLNCGYSKPRVLDVPAGIKVAVEKQTLIIISGHDKVAVGDFAAKVRFQKPPEPYKGKGIRFEGEKIKLKEGKSAGGKKK